MWSHKSLALLSTLLMVLFFAACDDGKKSDADIDSPVTDDLLSDGSDISGADGSDLEVTDDMITDDQSDPTDQTDQSDQMVTDDIATDGDELLADGDEPLVDGDELLTDDDVIVAPDNIVYVDLNATGAGDGTSWADAYTDLSTAIEEAEAGEEIWVAAGTYLPTQCPTSVQDACYLTPRERNFTLYAGVDIYGGFAGVEKARDQRDWTLNETILSGDLNGDDEWDDTNKVWLNREENTYHVIQLLLDHKFNTPAALDGFTIMRGYANGDDLEGVEEKGGGLDAIDNADSAEPVIRNCVFRDNFAITSGGAVSFMNIAPVIENCAFLDNSAVHGGALSLINSVATVTGSRFDGNAATESGGAVMSGNASTLELTDCTFTGNTAVLRGGAIVSPGSDLTAEATTFDQNAVSDAEGNSGGAIYFNGSVLTLIGSTFSGNTAVSEAAAISTYGATAVTITDSIFEQNSDGGTTEGGAIFVHETGPLTMTGTRFSQNTGTSLSAREGSTVEIVDGEFSDNAAVNAAAIRIEGGSVFIVTATRFLDNHADLPGDGFAGLGGAVQLSNMDGTAGSSATIVNSVFSGNSAALWGGALIFLGYSDAELINCTFNGNADGGDDAIVFVQSDPVFVNTVVWDEMSAVVGAVGPYNFAPSNPSFSYSNVMGSGGSAAWAPAVGVDGGNNIDEDPDFVATGDDPLALQSTSPCINAGNNAAVPAGVTTDLLGNDRIQDVTVDMGAYEF